ncbi:MAG: deoxyribodipyrimidine photo-lyase [Bacteriovoracaceae bacterium]|nr:deoxyribodipyrimidine photo-lyase [Bacteriovoracaceae bacterium]
MKSLVWLRRDMRLKDQMALSYATQNSDEVYLAFVFDKVILDKLEDRKDHRLYFIYKTLEKLNEFLSKKNAGIYLLHGDPIDEIPKLAHKLKVERVCVNRDYEQYAKDRDSKVEKKLKDLSIEMLSFKDQVIFESSEILTGDGNFYKVFTPYKNSWLKELEKKEDAFSIRPVNVSKITYKNIKGYSKNITLDELGFEEADNIKKRDVNPSKTLKEFLKRIDRYHEDRDFPALDSTSHLSVYLRFGNISIRELVRSVRPTDTEGKKVWLSELVWRDFYSGFLDVHNNIENESYKYGSVEWDNDPKLIKAWKEGRTGVPIVDAGMRQLNQTGWMHNRVRMIVGSYLTKILQVDWRIGEKYFGEKLIDYDLASNNGGWQWCSSTGTDAAPYFRIFNPYRQSERFDKDAKYIKKFVPELEKLPPKYIHEPLKITEDIEKKFGIELDKDYPRPVADYKSNREKSIKMFKEASNA